MKKYLVVATVLVALVALFSFSASAADVALDANFTYDDENGVTIDRIAVNLSGANAPKEDGGYYTVLAYTGAENPTEDGAKILYAAQEVNAITGFNVAAADLVDGSLHVKFGGTGIDKADKDSAKFVFALVALNKERKALEVSPYGSVLSLTVDGADAYEVWGAELKGIDDAGLTEKQKELYEDNLDEEFAIRSFRKIIPVVPAVAE